MSENLKKDVFHVGEHCAETACNKLDFLPVRCDGCRKNFCNDHFRYENHHCSSGRTANNQVPVCPLCNAPIPVKRGEIPDLRVGQHIDSDCQSETALSKRKVYGNLCSLKGCKKKEMMRVECEKCRKTYCLTHRFPDDHNCTPAAVSRAGNAALARIARLANTNPSSQKHRTSGSSSSSSSSNQQNSNKMTEDEAFARALQLSLNVGQGDGPSTSGSHNQPTIKAPRNQEEEDLALAQALAASEAEFQAQTQRNKSPNCVMA